MILQLARSYGPPPSQIPSATRQRTSTSTAAASPATGPKRYLCINAPTRPPNARPSSKLKPPWRHKSILSLYQGRQLGALWTWYMASAVAKRTPIQKVATNSEARLKWSLGVGFILHPPCIWRQLVSQSEEHRNRPYPHLLLAPALFVVHLFRLSGRLTL